MPTYSNTTPPYALFPGDVGYSFGSAAGGEAMPADGTAGSQLAVPQPAGFPKQGHDVRWQTLFTGSPTAVNFVLQAALNDVDAEYGTIDTSTVISGEARTVVDVAARFLRIKKVSSTGGTSPTVVAKLIV